jgi:hypothetical protein
VPTSVAGTTSATHPTGHAAPPRWPRASVAPALDFFMKRPYLLPYQALLAPILSAGLLLTAGAAVAQGPRLPAAKAATPPAIDGDLAEEVWQGPPLATGFTNETRPPTEDTRVRAAFDGKALYFAFECVDSTPQQIRSQQTKRNGDLESDDWVAVGIDPLGDKKTMYWFHVNPRGTQAEEIPGGAATKVQWRGDWNAAAKINEKGWTAEMAIPFELLKYPSGQKQFGLIFRRNLARIGEGTSWPSGTNYHAHENQAWWTGVEAPKQVAVPRFMPYSLLGFGGNIKNGAGIDIKYTAPNNITGLLAIRPDFQTIEEVVQTVDFSYNQRFIPDRRPFFTDGGDYFGDGMMFYSRSIGEIDAGLKSFGKIGRLGFGAMGTSRLGAEHNLLLNAQYDVSDRSDVGLSMVQHFGSSLDNRVLKLSANWRKPMRINGFYWGASAYQSQGPGANGTAFRAYLDRWTGWGIPGYHIYYARIPNDYNPSLAFVPERDVQRVGGWVDYGQEYKTGPVLNWMANLGYNYATHLDGRLFYEGLSPEIGVMFRRNWFLELEYDYSNRPPNRDRVLEMELGLNVRDIYRATRLGVRSGRLDGGRYLFASLNQGFKLTDKFSMGIAVERLSLDYPDQRTDLGITQGVLSGVYDITAEKGVVFRLVGNGDGANGYMAYRQELRRGMDVFFVVGDPNARTFTPRFGLKVVNTY